MTKDAMEETKRYETETTDGGPDADQETNDSSAGTTYEELSQDEDRWDEPATDGVNLGTSETDVSGIAAELEETKQQLLRVHADFDNFRRRTRQEKEDLQKYATKKLLSDLLPVMDNFDRALAAPAGDGQGELLAGLEMVRRQLLTVLEQHGVTPMACVGQPFDPNLHEAVMQEPAGETEPGLVSGELQKGYWISGRVLRAAMVKVTV